MNHLPISKTFVDALADLPTISAPDSQFTLFVVADASSIGDDEIATLLHPWVTTKLMYFCAWGPHCERVHDTVDRLFRQLSDSETRTLMTTWHADEPLEEAVWYFDVVAWPSEVDPSHPLTRIAIVAGNMRWMGEFETYLRGGLDQQ